MFADLLNEDYVLIDKSFGAESVQLTNEGYATYQYIKKSVTAVDPQTLNIVKRNLLVLIAELEWSWGGEKPQNKGNTTCFWTHLKEKHAVWDDVISTSQEIGLGILRGRRNGMPYYLRLAHLSENSHRNTWTDR
jgi:hypothetical protein